MRTLTDPSVTGLDALALYNGLDVQAPLTIHRSVRLLPIQERVYRAEMALQAPALACVTISRLLRRSQMMRDRKQHR
jgi:hypothetical protein